VRGVCLIAGVGMNEEGRRRGDRRKCPMVHRAGSWGVVRWGRGILSGVRGTKFE
jgi:hypothetical protein